MDSACRWVLLLSIFEGMNGDKKKDKVQLGTLEEGNGAPAGSGVAYLRVSTSGQEEGTSLDVQREKVFALSSVLGVAIAPHHIISEVGSGADPDRRGLLTVWNLVERKEVQHVFAYDTTAWPETRGMFSSWSVTARITGLRCTSPRIISRCLLPGGGRFGLAPVVGSLAQQT